MKHAAGALALLMGIAVGAHMIYSLLAPLLPLLISGAVLVIVYATASGLWRRL